MKKLLLLCLAIISPFFNGYGLSGDNVETNENEKNVIHWLFTFDYDKEGFEAIFSDYHDDAGNNESYQMEYGHKEIPVEGNKSMGLYIASMNRSDDIFMAFFRRLDGLLANQSYRFEVSFLLATDVNPGLTGVGGSPGEGVVVKGGVTNIRPESSLDLNDGIGIHYRMNIDIGQQHNSGRDMIVIGNMAKPEDMVKIPGFIFKEMDFIFQVTTDSNGHAYLIIGTDSGFEGFTEFYLDNIEVRALKSVETGIKELTAQNSIVNLYPNPTTGELRIASGELQVESVEIFDITGKTIQHFNVATTINVSHLSNGIYFVKIKTDKGELTQKIIKQ